MIQIDMGMPKDCKECPFMATDGKDTLSPMMCAVIWGINHEVKHCIQGKIRDDCPLKEVPMGKWLKEDRGHVEYTAVCSVCGETEFWSERSRYCPSCGALMVEEQQGENTDDSN